MIISLLFRNLFFTLLQPGIVAGYVPYLILKSNQQWAMQKPTFTAFLGAALFLIGLFVMLNCILNFAVIGRGTLSPADPTKNLVAKGLYKYSRNPMYLGVLLILAGESVFFRSCELGAYSLFIFLAFHLFVVFREEPRLKKDFGTNYELYLKKVGRWI